MRTPTTSRGLRAGAATVAAVAALGLTACTSTGTTTQTTQSPVASASPATTAMATSAAPQAASVVPPPRKVGLTDTNITLAPGQLAEWRGSAIIDRAVVFTDDPGVFVRQPRDAGEPVAIRAVGPGTATATVYLDSQLPSQVLSVTVTVTGG